MKRILPLLLTLLAAVAGADTSRHERPFNPQTLGLQRSFLARSPGVKGLVASPDGKHLVVAGADGNVRLFDVQSGKEVRIVTKHPSFAWALAFSPDGHSLATGGDDGEIRLFDTRTWKQQGTLTGHAQYVYGLAWSPDARVLASGGVDQTVRLWEPTSGRELRALTDHTSAVGSVSWSPDGKRLASAAYDGSIKIWDSATGNEERLFGGGGTAIVGSAWSRDGRFLLTGRADGSIQMWDPMTGTSRWTGSGHESSVYGVAFSRDLRYAITAGGKLMRVWETESGKPCGDFRHHSADIQGLVVGPGSIWIATAANDYQVKIWGRRPGGMAGVRPKGFFGISVQTSNDAVLVTAVIANTAAERAGMQKGDLLLSVGETKVTTMEESIGAIGSYGVDDEVEFTVQRDGREIKLKAKLGARPADVDR